MTDGVGTSYAEFVRMIMDGTAAGVGHGEHGRDFPADAQCRCYSPIRRFERARFSG
ncbi:hypothetical protein [Streptomyces sp. NPDC054783]